MGSEMCIRDRSGFALALSTTSMLRGKRFEDAGPLFSVPLPADVDPYLPYSRAWLRFQAADLRGSYVDMAAAAKHWAEQAPAAFDSELAMMAAHARVPAAEVSRLLAQLPGDRAEKLHVLATAYRKVGEYRFALETLAMLGDAAGVRRAVRFRRRSDLHYQLGEPASAAEQLLVAMDRIASSSCSDDPQRCSQVRSKLNERAIDMARFFHTVYVTTQDPAYFGPARDLYAALVRTSGRRQDLQQALRDLEHYKLAAKPHTGLHAAEILAPFVHARVDTVAGCYRAALVSESELSGVMRITWSIDASGAVTGAASEPPKGQSGIARVADCVMAQGRGWRYPARVVPGETRLTVRYELAQRPE